MGNPSGPEFGQPTPRAGLGAGRTPSAPARRNRRDRRLLVDTPERRGATPPITSALIVAEVRSYFSDLGQSPDTGTYLRPDGITREVEEHTGGRLLTARDAHNRLVALHADHSGRPGEFGLRRPMIGGTAEIRVDGKHVGVSLPSEVLLEHHYGGPLNPADAHVLRRIKGRDEVDLGELGIEAKIVIAKIFLGET